MGNFSTTKMATTLASYSPRSSANGSTPMTLIMLMLTQLPTKMLTTYEGDVPLGRKNIEHSLASDIIDKCRDTGSAHGKDHSLTYVFMRMGEINRENWPQYLFGVIFASSISFLGVAYQLDDRCYFIVTGMVYPVFGISVKLRRLCNIKLDSDTNYDTPPWCVAPGTHDTRKRKSRRTRS